MILMKPETLVDSSRNNSMLPSVLSKDHPSRTSNQGGSLSRFKGVSRIQISRKNTIDTSRNSVQNSLYGDNKYRVGSRLNHV